MINQKGRSMVEMLGVLAIIGVLSVGAIAGYSKAMMKYKLNKHAEAFNLLINNFLTVYPRLEHYSGNGDILYNTILNQLGSLPDGITFEDRSRLSDSFGSEIVVYATKGNYGIRVFIDVSYGLEVCQNVINVAKEYHTDIWNIQTDEKAPDKDDYSKKRPFYGDQYCNPANNNCLATATIGQIHDACNFCDSTKEWCRFYLHWKD